MTLVDRLRRSYHPAMTIAIHTHFLSSLFEPSQLRGATAVVVDVLRAGTTICHALDAGANAVVPCEEVDEARRLAESLSSENPVLGGERDGKLIDGFDLDNSPFSYTPESVGGRTVVFTTSNGTRALHCCREAERVLIGAFNNLSALGAALEAGPWPVHLVCAGTDGQISSDDVLFAGAVANETLETIDDVDLPDDQTAIAMDCYLLNLDELMLQVLRASLGGRNLIDLGLEDDVLRAAEIDRFDFVPVYDPKTGRICKPQA